MNQTGQIDKLRTRRLARGPVVLREPIQVDGGVVALPDQPGLGIEADRKVLAQLMA